ncbi:MULTISPECIES: cytochrome aa3 quinol oxidase subunit II [Bacillus]|uniref:Quinol oxidase subunit 2 n=4 Tax=Bacillus amyloliquefaciens group TaxID=1938374 RepID=A0A235BGG5_BACVE|nr:MULTISPECIES: cytochrome aa3 quinol oxidase subunit II [Bacillus]MBA9147820.1 cytochrome aa3 quinol oxidase subunit II [Bacillus sp. EKM213B]MBL3612617.1 cytochrome aa3 quinol oxidase subunit II [Bacillus sp. RHFS18]MBR7815794.1 cytochrome aa3 quinol oxidase subunit II [Bacillus sp. CCNWLCWHY013]MBU8886395.1 cytochrome aa3 quinol oxidase subunit II [Bacillus sp. FJAT-27001]SLB02852.1 heme/copper-type cytochrome/quinol oxidase, subunit 2 [Mycobacteroides abscessus subsp. massiliense]
MIFLFRAFKPLLLLAMLAVVFVLGGCSDISVLDPKGPVADQQKDLILLSIGFMLFIVGVVFVLFTIILVKYRDRKGKDSGNYKPEMHGNTFLEVVWTVIPILIVIALSVPTVQTIYSLEKAPEATKDKEPLVVYATSVDWKWVFSYPEQDIETVNYLNIPVDRPVLFKISSADSMASLWIPQLGGQKYAMAGMLMDQYLQADKVGTYEGRNANFTGEHFADQKFNVKAVTQKDFNSWVKKAQSDSPKLTKEKYDELMLPENVGKLTFSSTHLKYVDHGQDAEYAMEARKRLGYKAVSPHSKTDPWENVKKNEFKVSDDKQD